MKGGYVAIARDKMEHPVLQSAGPATKKEAWWWLNANAAYRDGTVVAGKGARARTIRLKRGQLSHSLRFLGKAWGWDHVTVSRFLNTLRNSGWLDLEPDAATGQTLITICHYDEFSLSPRSGETAVETPDETAPATANETNKKESNPSGFLKTEKKKEARSSSEPRAREAAALVRSNFEDWWREQPHKVGEMETFQAYRAAHARVGPAVLLTGLRRYIETKPPDQKWLNPVTWLRKERWPDRPAQQPTMNGGRKNERSNSAADNLYAGFAAAAGFDSGDGGPTAEPLLDAGPAERGQAGSG
jgi:hypothetical protein